MTSQRSTVDQVCAAVRGRAGPVDELIEREVRRVAPLATADERTALVAAVRAHLHGLGELERLMTDAAVTEILVNAGSEIWVERHGSLQPEGVLGGHDVVHLIERILAPLGRRVDSTTPIVDARLADRSRICAVVPPLAVDGPCLSIRRFPPRPRPLADFVDEAGAHLCSEVIRARSNVVVSGATSSGKTSLVACLLTLLDPSERVVMLEDTAELPATHGHVVRLEARPPTPDGPPEVVLGDLVRTALRLRPDRLVVGEVRGSEVLGLVQALNTGHDGSLSTCHANGPLDALYRLETLLLQTAPGWPLSAIRQQLARSIDVVIHLARRSGGRRTIDSIVEVCRPEPDDPHPGLTVLPLAEADGHRLRRCRALSRRRSDR